VSRGGWTSAALALLLIVSLTGKLLVGYQAGPNDDRRLADALQRRLSAAGFATSLESRIAGLVVHGARGPCRVTVRDGDNWPVLAVVFEQRARPYGPLRYVYRGDSGVAPPRVRPAIDRITRRIAGAFGIDATRPALLAVAATPACGQVGRLFDGVTVSRAPG
jgi:hypothetical protein